MRKVNFDTLNRLTPPQEWIENALTIPKTRRSPVLRVSHLLSAAAGFLLAVALSAVVFLMIGDRSPIAVTPADASTGATAIGSTDTATLAEERTTSPSQANAPTGATTTTDENGRSVIIYYVIGGSDSTDPAEGGAPSVTIPLPTTGVETHQPDTSAAATDAPETTRAPAEDQILSAFVAADAITGEGRVYCMVFESGVYTAEGDGLGVGDRFDDTRLCDRIMQSGDRVLVAYNTSSAAVPLVAGESYTYRFYNEDGVTLAVGDFTAA